MERKKDIIRMENTLAKKGTRLAPIQQKMFYITLANINNINADNEICVLKEDLFSLMDITHNNRHTYLREQLKKLRDNSEISFGTDEEFCDGYLIYRTRTTRKEVFLRIDSDYIPMLKELSSNYTRLLLDDCMTFSSKFSMMLYQQLMRLNGAVKVIFTTHQLKDFFGLDKDDYVKPTGKFDRFNFEKYTVNLAVKEINEKSKCIHNLRYEKTYRGRSVQGYAFEFTYSDPQKVADAKQDFCSALPGQQTIYDYEKDKVVEVSDFDWLHQ